MMRMSRKSFIVLLAVGFAFLTFIFRYAYFVSYIRFPIASGIDTVGHVELGKYYAQYIFPSIWGWAPRWFGGMPFPQFYPPFFYILAAFISKILPFLHYELVFKFLILFLSLIIPGLLIVVTSRITKSRISLVVAGAAGLFLLMTPFGKYDTLGVSLGSTFSVGLVTHVLAFDCLLLWIAMFLESHRSRLAYYSSIVLLALTALSSVHVIFIVFAVYFFSFCFFRKKVSVMRFYIVPGLLSVGLAGFWLLPLSTVYSIMPTQSFGLTNGIGAPNLWAIVVTWWPTAIVMLGAVIGSVYQRNKRVWILLLASLCVIVSILVSLDKIFIRLPFHTYRLLPFVYFSGAVAAGYIYDLAAERWKGEKVRVGLALAIAALFAIAWLPYRNVVSTKIFYSNYSKDNAFGLAAYMQDKQGMFAVEVAPNARSLYYLIEQEQPENLRSNYSIFVDSSLGSIFQVPFRDSITARGGEYLTVHTLLTRPAFNVKNSDRIVARAKTLGISYLIVQSAAMKTLLAKTPEMTLDASFGNWSIFHLGEVRDAQVVPYQPALFFGDLGVKGVDQSSVNFFLLQEKLFLDNDLDLTIAKSPATKLDQNDDLSQFSSAIISSYDYHDREKARTILDQYAAGHHLILVASSDPLFAELKSDLQDNPLVSFVEYDTAQSGSELSRLCERAADSVLALLEQNKIPVASSPEVAAVFSRNRINLALSTTSSQELPVLVRSSYFPSWQRADGEAAYLATPAYVLTFVKNSAELDFKKPLAVPLGAVLTIFSALTIGLMMCYE